MMTILQEVEPKADAEAPKAKEKLGKPSWDLDQMPVKMKPKPVIVSLVLVIIVDSLTFEVRKKHPGGWRLWTLSDFSDFGKTVRSYH